MQGKPTLSQIYDPVVAVLTGDIVQSRRHDGAAVDAAMECIGASAVLLSDMADGDCRFTRFRGDGWQIVLRTATEREWVDDLRLCPMTPAGCSRAGGCSGTCVTGTVIQHSGRWLVYVSPGESTDGHVVTVRHEVAHVFSWCTTGALDYAHSTPGVWGAAGVVWRADGR